MRKDNKKDQHPIKKEKSPILNWLGPNLIKKQKEFSKVFDFPEDEEVVSSESLPPLLH